MSKDYDPMPGLIERLERQNECLRHALDLGIKMRKAQAAYFKDRSRDNLIASKVAEADFDKAARACVESNQ